MIVYYKRFETYLKWPTNDVVDETWVEYSLSKNKWNCFMKSDVCLDMKQRTELVAKFLNKKPGKITLEKH